MCGNFSFVPTHCHACWLAGWVCFITFSINTKDVPIKENPECFHTLDFFMILLMRSENFSKILPVNKLEHKILSNHAHFL